MMRQRAADVRRHPHADAGRFCWGGRRVDMSALPHGHACWCAHELTASMTVGLDAGARLAQLLTEAGGSDEPLRHPGPGPGGCPAVLSVPDA